ncbi:MAG: 1-acyl-sn-glycerol-3-phosphate acyltransferase [Halocynthiibacter sp.]|jgi:1-acyl-sn-glycerol-3-phosphate acyltransferase
MKNPIQWLLSFVFIIQMYLMMILMAAAYYPLALIDRKYAFKAVRTYCRYVRFTARWMIGLRTEIRGEVPQGEVVIASKHQSFLDIILIVSVAPRPKFIMKKQILWTPIVGFYAKRMRCVAVDRGKRGVAIKKMVEDVKTHNADPSQLIIFPQGTRVAAGAHLPYKIGTAVLYEQTGQACVPAATNVGVFWPRHGFYRKRGLAVLEFLPLIEQGLSKEGFMTRLEADIETASDVLMREAGFDLPAKAIEK